MVKQEIKIQTNTSSLSLSSSSPSSPSSSSSSLSSSTKRICKKKNKIKKYKGVRMRSWGSWVSEIRAPNQKTRIWLGSYSTAEAAARAYDVALLCLKGPQANLNFPNLISTTSFDEMTLLSPKSIQRVAAQAANSSSFDPFAPSSSPSSSSAASSPSDHHQHHHDDNGMLPLMDSSSWYDDDLNRMLFLDDVTPFDYSLMTTMVDDLFYEDADIPLWSFT